MIKLVVAHHFHAGVTPAAVMRSSASNSLALHTGLESFHEASVASVFLLGLWISGVSEDGHVIVENSVCHHVEGEKRMPPP